ncbi:MAG: hypothetical protein R3D66_04465 [Alphaproteobacteria bacterium]
MRFRCCIREKYGSWGTDQPEGRCAAWAADDIAAKADLMEDVIEKIEAASQSARAESESLMESAAEHSAKLSSAGQDNIRELKEVVALLEESRSRIESLSAVAQTQIGSFECCN